MIPPYPARRWACGRVKLGATLAAPPCWIHTVRAVL